MIRDRRSLNRERDIGRKVIIWDSPYKHAIVKYSILSGWSKDFLQMQDGSQYAFNRVEFAEIFDSF